MFNEINFNREKHLQFNYEQHLRTHEDYSKPRTTANGVETVAFLGQNLWPDLPVHIKEFRSVCRSIILKGKLSLI